MLQLRICDALFERKIAAFAHRADRLSTEEVLARIDALAYYAVSVMSSRLADPRIERVLLARGRQEMLAIPLATPPSRPRRKILHVATVIHSVGGLTSIIANWVAQDTGSEHVVALTCQSAPPPAGFVEQLRASGSELYLAEVSRSKLERARALRQFVADRGFTHIVLDHYPYDSIPLLAFAADGGPPVLVYNHSDQLFWNGASVADAVIEFCPSSTEVSWRNRGIHRALYLPLVMGGAPPPIARAEAKRRLGFSPETLLLVSIGRKMKYLPWRDYDFFATYGQLLSLVPEAVLVVVGVGEADRPELGITTKPPNLVLAGEVIDPSLYAMAADIYVECFPLGAGLGACDMGRYGAAPLFVYGPGLSIDGTIGGGLFEGCELPPHAQTAEEQIQLALLLCRDEAARRRFGDAFAAYINSRSVGGNWLAYLENIYRATDGLAHRVTPDLEVELLPRARRINRHANTCRPVDLIYHSLQETLRHHAWLGRTLRTVVFNLARPKWVRQLLRKAPGLFGFLGKS